MSNHGPLCKRIKNDKENILKSTTWKRQRIYNWCVSKVLQYSNLLLDQVPFYHFIVVSEDEKTCHGFSPNLNSLKMIKFPNFWSFRFFKLSRKKSIRFKIRLFSDCLCFPFGNLRKLWSPSRKQWFLFGNIWKYIKFWFQNGVLADCSSHSSMTKHHVAWLIAYHVVLPIIARKKIHIASR